MGLSNAMDWWDEWKLRILVLCSLFAQFFLYFAETVRTWYVLRRLRFMVWIAYIGGDALAVYALATLFNRQKQHTADGGKALEVLWAPVLLFHLGGQYISAYSLEDNELWKRHTITLVSQVTVALYVFCKWWSGEKRLFQAAVLLFIVGIIRFCEKPWALRKASFRTVASSTTLASPQRDGRSSSKCSAVCSIWRAICTCTNFMEMEGVQEDEIDDISCSLEEYIKKARELVNGAKASTKAHQQAQLKMNRIRGIRYIYRLFLDLSSSYSIRLHFLQYFLEFDNEYGHKTLRQWIGRQYLLMYTKSRSTYTHLGSFLLLLLPSLASASVVLFAKSSKDGYNNSDITVTYILFSATAVREFAPYLISLLCLSLFRCNLTNQLDMVYSWQDMVSQHNIILFCAKKQQPISALMKHPSSALMKLAVGFSCCLRDYINKHWYKWRQPVAQQISVLVRRHAEDGWKKYIRDPASYRRFNNLRGEQTLRKHHLLGQLAWSFGLPFDECVLVWHVATAICSFHPTNTASSQGSRHNSEIISNHMIHMLFIYPEMLMLGTRQDLFLIACGDIESMIKEDNKPPPSLLDERSIAQWILSRIMEQADDLATKAPMISKAHRLAKALIDLDDNDKMWEVIQGVWVEMLCYSASRSRGYEHAKSLAHGGEFLTNVWLMWSVMGMETLPDKIHNPGLLESNDYDEEQAPVAASD